MLFTAKTRDDIKKELFDLLKKKQDRKWNAERDEDKLYVEIVKPHFGKKAGNPLTKIGYLQFHYYRNTVSSVVMVTSLVQKA